MKSNSVPDPSSGPMVSYLINTFNRLGFLKNLLESFQLCNVYPNYEWIIADYGSTDGTRDFLQELEKTKNKFTILLRDEDERCNYMKTLGLEPKHWRQRVAVVIGQFRREAREIAKGDLFFELSDDFQFIRKGDWVQDVLSVYSHRMQTTGRNDSSGVNIRAMMLYRGYKRTNTPSAMQRTEGGTEYFVMDQKPFDLYSAMKRSTYEELGPFLEIDKMTDPVMIQKWKDQRIEPGPGNPEAWFNYMERAQKLNLKTMSLKYPCIVEIPNELVGKVRNFSELPLVPIFDEGEMERDFLKVDRTVSSDEIFAWKGITNYKPSIPRYMRASYFKFKKFLSYRKWRNLPPLP